MLWRFGALLTLGTAPSRASQFLEAVNSSPALYFLYINLADIALTPTTYFIRLSLLGHYFSTLITLGPDTRLERVLMPQGPWKLFKKPILSLLTLLYQFLSVKTIMKFLATLYIHTVEYSS